jgi:hypothetical protein
MFKLASQYAGVCDSVPSRYVRLAYGLKIHKNEVEFGVFITITQQLSDTIHPSNIPVVLSSCTMKTVIQSLVVALITAATVAAAAVDMDRVGKGAHYISPMSLREYSQETAGIAIIVEHSGEGACGVSISDDEHVVGVSTELFKSFGSSSTAETQPACGKQVTIDGMFSLTKE